MNNTFAINLPIPISRGATLKWKISFRFICLASFGAALILLILYIFQVNAMINETFLIQSYQKKLAKLSQDNQLLEINFSQANSLANITDLIKNLNFEKASQIRYLQVLEGQVVSTQ